MDFWVRAAQLILSLSILVFLHELGHFIPARLFKTRVEKFYLFFNPWFSLYKKKVGETEWGIGWLPLGGYVKIAGMIDESMDKEQMAQPAQPWEFRSKPAWQRLIIMIGGVVVNVIVGFVIYGLVVATWGEDKLATKDLQHGLSVHPSLQKYGLKTGDNILTINDQPVDNFMDINAGIMIRDQYKLGVLHADGTKETITLPEDIEYKLFDQGAMRPFDLRHKSKKISVVTSTQDLSSDVFEWKKPSYASDLNVGDGLISLNGQELNDILSIEELTKDNDEKIVAKIAHGADTINYTVKGKNKKKFINAFLAFSGGLRPGDSIVKIADQEINYFDEIVQTLYNNKKKSVSVTYFRGNDTLTSQVSVSKAGTIGFAPVPIGPEDTIQIKHYDYGFFASMGQGIGMGFETLGDYVGQMKFLFTSSGVKQVGGFGTIGKLFPPTWDWQQFWLNTAFISIILAFMNILPIPALDGGHVVFLLYEIITRREAPQKVLEVAQMIGFFILIALLLYANGNDIIGYFMK